MTLRLAASTGSWRDFCSEPEQLNRGLRASLDAGGVILLTSRFSTPTGENARTSAINSLKESVRGLARYSGIDVEGALPSSEDLDLRLQNAPVTRTKRLQSGSDILHRFVELDLRPAVPVVILMATGSGRIAAEGFIQPFTQRAAELTWKLKPALFVTKRWDRATRNDDLVGPLLMALSEHKTWVCTDKVFREFNEDARLQLMVESFAARSNTSGEDRAKRLGQADRTGRQLIGGQVAYHLPSGLPPGFGIATMKKRPGLEVEKIAYLDTPDCRPDPRHVAQGMSEVLDDCGQIVDQVANVQFFLARYGDPAWMDGDRLRAELVRRQFSTVHLRRLFGPNAQLSPERGHKPFESMLDNLDVYETGVLRRSPGGDVDAVEITGVMPPDGSWARPENFARIRAQIAKGQERAGRQVQLPFAGCKGIYNGVACRIRSIASPSTIHVGDPCLGFRRVREDGREVRVDQHVLLPWRVFAESVADGIIAAGAAGLELLEDSAAGASETATAELDLELTELDCELARLRQQRDGLVGQLGQLGSDGQPVLRGAFLTAAQNQYEGLDAKAVELERRRDGIIALRDLAANPSTDDADPGVVPRLLASLRDHADDTYVGMWRRIITPLVFTTSPATGGMRRSRRLYWRGAIRVDGGGGSTLVIPFEGSYDYRRIKPGRVRPRREHLERQHEFVTALRKGTPYEDIDLPARRVNKPRVARLLGIEVGHPLFSCTDPKILTTATTLLLHRQDASVPTPDGQDAFVAAIRRIHVEDGSTRPWRRRRGELVAAFHDLAGETGVVTVDAVIDRCGTTRGTVHTAFANLRDDMPAWESRRKRGYYLTPCPRCQSHDRRPAEISEITGLLCRNCEHDEAEVHWPLDTYGQYLA